MQAVIGCVNDTNIFCYICESFMSLGQWQNITSAIKKVFIICFATKLKQSRQDISPTQSSSQLCAIFTALDHSKKEIFKILCFNSVVFLDELMAMAQTPTTPSV